MKRVVISDTSCLIVLSKINQLDILHSLFGEVWISEDVRNEFGEDLPHWFIIKKANSIQIEKILSLNLDKGEASAIALYLEQKENALLVIDERKGRKIAKELGIKIIGTLGIIAKAKELGLISDLQKTMKELDKIDFRISLSIKQQMLGK